MLPMLMTIQVTAVDDACFLLKLYFSNSLRHNLLSYEDANGVITPG
jgi:hypothetical protein